MLSIKNRITYDVLADFPLPPTRMWQDYHGRKVSKRYSCEWYIWPEPTEREQDIINRLWTWRKVVDGKQVWQNENLVYTAQDFIYALVCPDDVKQLIFEMPTSFAEDYKLGRMAQLLKWGLFSPGGFSAIIAVMPIGDATQKPKYPERILAKRKVAGKTGNAVFRRHVAGIAKRVLGG